MKLISTLFSYKYYLILIIFACLFYLFKKDFWGGIDTFDLLILFVGFLLIFISIFIKAKKHLFRIIIFSILLLFLSLFLKNYFIKCSDLSSEQECVCNFLKFKTDTSNLDFKNDYLTSCEKYPNFNKEPI